MATHDAVGELGVMVEKGLIPLPPVQQNLERQKVEMLQALKASSMCRPSGKLLFGCQGCHSPLRWHLTPITLAFQQLRCMPQSLQLSVHAMHGKVTSSECEMDSSEAAVRRSG